MIYICMYLMDHGQYCMYSTVGYSDFEEIFEKYFALGIFRRKIDTYVDILEKGIFLNLAFFLSSNFVF